MNATARTLISMMALVGVAFLLTTPATAALQRFETKRQLINQQGDLSPRTEIEQVEGTNGVATIDESGANPILRRLVWTNPGGALGLTVIVPDLAGGFAWFRGKTDGEGPSNDMTGTGSSASSINWGNITGWTVSGVTFCRSIPSYICPLAGYVDNISNPQINYSTNYDYGTWVFHGTGFTHTGVRLFFTAPTSQGNSLNIDRGVRSQNGTVPALPLIGVGSVALSVFALGIAAARRR